MNFTPVFEVTENPRGVPEVADQPEVAPARNICFLFSFGLGTTNY